MGAEGGGGGQGQIDKSSPLFPFQHKNGELHLKELRGKIRSF